jgi:peptidoglycan/xylan/chitin deacetylase (PgdA/CDA1 family)
MKVLNLIFHGIGEPGRALEPGEEKVWVSRAGLRSVLETAAGRADIRLSFDDGNRSDLTEALPELLRFGRRATFFVVAGRTQTPGFLTAADLRELIAAGMNVQSHGMRHRVWRGLPPASLHEELVTARERLEEIIAAEVGEVALPYCQYDRATLRALRAAGYRRVFTCDGGYADPDAWLQARNQISAGEDGRKIAELQSPPLRLSLARALKGPIKRWR